MKRSLCPLLVLNGGRYICLWVSMTTLNSEEITLSSDSVECGEGISAFECQWQHWTVKRSLSPLIVLNVGRGISAFECQWQHWTVKRSLCPLIVLKVGGISAYESQWQHWTVKRSLCLLLLLPRGYICLWVSMTKLNSKEVSVLC